MTISPQQAASPQPASAVPFTRANPWRAAGPWWPGVLTLALLLVIGIGPLLALLRLGGGEAPAIWQDPWLRHVVLFSLGQAALSTLLSVGIGLPVARALYRRTFPGRSLLIRLAGITQVLPVIIALFGLVAVHGRQGWLGQLLAPFGITLPSYLYGLGGILLAHVFFNMPLAARWLLFALEAIPAGQWRLAAQLGMPAPARWRWIEWPALRPQLMPLASLIFLLCFSSFTTVMALGGGPGATTLEVAVYQALRFDFDPAAAATLALWHLLLGSLVLFGHYLAQQPAPGASRQPLSPWRRDPAARRWPDVLWLLLAGLIFLPPLLAIVVSGLHPGTLHALGQPMIWQALVVSLQIGSGSAALACLLSLGLLFTTRHLRWRRRQSLLATTLESAGSLNLLIPTAVLGTGLFLLLQPLTDVFRQGFWLVMLLNAIACLPYTLRTLQPALQLAVSRYDRLATSLGLRGLARWRYLEWPLLRRALGRAAALAMIYALGDLGAVALFGSADLQTLPWLLYQQLGSYRLDDAAATALLLLVLCVGLLALIETLFGGRDASR